MSNISIPTLCPQNGKGLVLAHNLNANFATGDATTFQSSEVIDGVWKSVIISSLSTESFSTGHEFRFKGISGVTIKIQLLLLDANIANTAAFIPSNINPNLKYDSFSPAGIGDILMHNKSILKEVFADCQNDDSWITEQVIGNDKGSFGDGFVTVESGGDYVVKKMKTLGVKRILVEGLTGPNGVKHIEVISV